MWVIVNKSGNYYTGLVASRPVFHPELNKAQGFRKEPREVVKMLRSMGKTVRAKKLAERTVPNGTQASS